jgi:predicted ATPase
MSSGSAYGLLRQVLWNLCGILEGEPLPEQQRKLQERLSLRVPESQRQPVVEFVGELCGIPFSDADRPQLRKARQQPELMGEQVGQALIEFLTAECAAQPVLMVLEDMHWADSLSINLLVRMLRDLAEQPFFILGVARPEVTELFPGLRTERMQEILLRGLSKRACERLVVEILGRDLTAEMLTQIVQQAMGNALFLEEPMPTLQKTQKLRAVPTVGAHVGLAGSSSFRGALTSKKWCTSGARS